MNDIRRPFFFAMVFQLTKTWKWWFCFFSDLECLERCLVCCRSLAFGRKNQQDVIRASVLAECGVGQQGDVYLPPFQDNANVS